jgi:hypothetical protein
VGISQPEWYFQGIYEEDGRHPEESQHAVQLTSEEVLRLVVMPDEQGRYRFDEMRYENLPEYLGYLVGYLGGPLAPDEAEHYRKQQAQQEYLCRSVPDSMTRDGNGTRLSQKSVR